MLNLRGKAELRACAMRIEFHGEDRVKAITIKLAGKMQLDVAQEGFVSQLGLFYAKDGTVQITEIEPIEVTRSVENARATIGGVHFSGMRVDGVRLKPLDGEQVEYTLKLKGTIEGGLDALHDSLMSDVDVEIEERERPQLAAVA